MSDTNFELKRLADYKNGPPAEQVVNKHHIAYFRRIVNGFWKSKVINNNYFPGALPVSLEKRDFYKLKKYEYAVTAKTDGMRFFLLMTRHKEEPITLMVDRGFSFYKIRNFSYEEHEDFSKLYDNTLFDGELIKNNSGKWTFFVYDCVCFNGENVSNEKYFNRLAYVHDFIESYNDDNGESEDTFSINTKPILNFTAENLRILQETQFDYSTDGLVLTPVILPVESGTQYSMFKYKDIEHHTFDFKIVVTDDEEITGDRKLTFYMTNKSELKKFMEGNTYINEDVDEFYKQLIELENYKPSCIVECRYDMVNDKYIPIMVRTDKTHPNGQTTIQRTFVNIKENIQVDDLIALAEECGK